MFRSTSIKRKDIGPNKEEGMHHILKRMRREHGNCLACLVIYKHKKRIDIDVLATHEHINLMSNIIEKLKEMAANETHNT